MTSSFSEILAPRFVQCFSLFYSVWKIYFFGKQRTLCANKQTVLLSRKCEKLHFEALLSKNKLPVLINPKPFPNFSTARPKVLAI